MPARILHRTTDVTPISWSTFHQWQAADGGHRLNSLDRHKLLHEDGFLDHFGQYLPTPTLSLAVTSCSWTHYQECIITRKKYIQLHVDACIVEHRRGMSEYNILMFRLLDARRMKEERGDQHLPYINPQMVEQMYTDISDWSSLAIIARRRINQR